jgi:dTDP-4-amino-4,6-dideoxygalactose transaminase
MLRDGAVGSGRDPNAALPPPGLVPVLRPRLPRAERLAPYLKRIDDKRVYSNWGPLVRELEDRLAGQFGLQPGCVGSASSGTAALVGAILAVAGRASDDRDHAVVPGLTFIASAVAVQQCGYRLLVADVDAQTWALDPDRLVRDLDLERVGVVVPVAPYGRPVEQEPWRAFAETTGIPVVIDAAAAFEAVRREPERYVGPVPAAMSFHATKSFSTGEGGGVVCADADTTRSVEQCLNFGLYDVRDSQTPSINGKLSEYHAAVGLAELDTWEEKAAAAERVAASYRRAFAGTGGADGLRVAPDISSTYALYVCNDLAQAEAVTDSLIASRVDHRFWYGTGLHGNSYLTDVAREPLPVTESLSPRLVGLPMAVDLEDDDIARVASAVAAALG